MEITHGDGSLRKTTKSSLMSVLVKNVAVLPSLPPSLIPTAFVIDAMALVQVMKSASSAEQYCMLRQSSYSWVDLVFE